MTKQPPLVLVDGSSYLYRAFHALPPLSTSTGQPTGAVRGVISMLRRLLKDYPDSVVAIVFDAKGKTFRDKIFTQYKAHRPPMPDDLKLQIQPIHEIINALRLPLLMVDGVEADDVIGTLAIQAAHQGLHVVISTGDKDMAQLVTDKITLVNTMTATELDVAGVKAKFGVPPSLIIDYLALMGDKVDNIPGVPGVGEKTAKALLQGIGGIASIYNNLDKIPALNFRGAKTIAKNLQAHRQDADLSYQLATIKTDVDLDITTAELTNAQLIKKGPDNERLLSLYRSLEFKSWIDELQADETLSSNAVINECEASSDTAYHCLTTESALDQWIKCLQNASAFAFDTETTSLNYMQARLVGFSFAVTPGEAAYVPCGHDYPNAPKQLTLARVLEKLKPLLEDPKLTKIGQNLKYDASVLANYDVHLRGIGFDTMLESYVYNATATRHDMDSLAKYYLNRQTIHFEDIAGKGTKQLTFNQIAIENAAPYAAEDADISLRLHQTLWSKIKQTGQLKQVFTRLEMPLVPLLSRIERQGVLVDAVLLKDQSAELGHQLESLEQQAYELAGEIFNLSSPKQLAHILFEKLSLPVLKKTPKKQSSTAEEVLKQLAYDYPLPRVLMEHRVLSKLKSTYTDKLPQMINDVTGRIHTSYHQAVTATGRLSSSDPNLQNIPIRTQEGRRIRQAFIAPAGYKIVAADYSQIELRIMAHLSKDPGLLEAFNRGLDVHQATAAEVFGVDLDAVTGEQRRRAKAINFGLIYGMSAFGLAKQLYITRSDAQSYIDCYFERYPGVKLYMDTVRHTAAQKGYVETLLGRRLYLPNINANNAIHRQAAERIAINAPMQGTAADIIKTAMITIDQWLQEEKLDAKIVMQVHDELVLEVENSIVGEVVNQVCERMATAVELDIPLSVDVGTGDNWDQAHWH
jgi:DNA polymerase I